MQGLRRMAAGDARRHRAGAPAAARLVQGLPPPCRYPRRADRAARWRPAGPGMGWPADLLAMRQPAGRSRRCAPEHRRGRGYVIARGPPGTRSRGKILDLFPFSGIPAGRCERAVEQVTAATWAEAFEKRHHSRSGNGRPASQAGCSLQASIRKAVSRIPTAMSAQKNRERPIITSIACQMGRGLLDVGAAATTRSQFLWLRTLSCSQETSRTI